MCRRLATTLAVVAAFAFVLDGALGGEHHLPTAMGGSHYHAHAHHSHGATVAADHQLVDSAAVDGVDIAAHHHGSSPQSGADTGSNCCSCVCAAVVLPCLSGEATPFVLIRNMAFASHRDVDGIVPEGLHRPPRPLSIA